MQNDRAEIGAERDTCQQQLAAARNELAALQDQVAREPEPQVPDGWTAVPGGAMIAIEGWALFDTGKATIQEGSKRILGLIVDTLKNDYPTKDVLVFGHTDNDQPSPTGVTRTSGYKDNWELSAQRALSVARHLSSEGIQSERIVACGCGEYRPRVPNDSERNKQKNRRVEIFVLDPQPHTGH
jgi:chemotaxis protein MotB